MTVAVSLSPDGNAASLREMVPHEMVSHDLDKVDSLIRKQPNSELSLINAVSKYIIGSGGKKLRPLVALLAFYGAGGTASDERRIVLAAAIELLHIATLLHDDVVDQSGMRRGRKAANVVWSNEACLLIGDFLYSRAFQLLSELNSSSITRDIAQTTNAIAEGEVAQFINRLEPSPNESTYMRVIHKKTAALFRAAAYNGAVLAKGNDATARAMADYGYHLGLAFQLFDDILDYKIKRDKKMAGDDLHNGKLTLPVIHALRHANAEDTAFIDNAFKQRDRGALARIVAIMQSTKSINYTLGKARDHIAQATRALDAVPQTDASDALATLAQLAITHE